MMKVRKVIQTVRSRIHYCWVWHEDLCVVLMVTICMALTCLYVYSVGQERLEEIRYIRGVTVVGF